MSLQSQLFVQRYQYAIVKTLELIPKNECDFCSQ